MRISGSLALAGYRVVVYALDQPPGYRFVDSTYPGLMTVLHLDGQERLLEPYCGEGYSGLLGKEKGRVAALLLRNAVIVVLRVRIDVAHQRGFQRHAAVVENLDSGEFQPVVAKP